MQAPRIKPVLFSHGICSEVRYVHKVHGKASPCASCGVLWQFLLLKFSERLAPNVSLTRCLFGVGMYTQSARRLRALT